MQSKLSWVVSLKDDHQEASSLLNSNGFDMDSSNELWAFLDIGLKLCS